MKVIVCEVKDFYLMYQKTVTKKKKKGKFKSIYSSMLFFDESSIKGLQKQCFVSHKIHHLLVPCVSFKDILLILKSFIFYFKALPQWVRMINDTQMDSGEKLQWECKAMGRPRPTYRWLRNGLPLTSQVPALPHNALAFLILPRNIWIIPIKLHNHYIYSIIPC